MTERRRDLLALLGLAALVQLLCALAFPGPLHPDEVHQYLEPAHRAVWGYGTRMHEWHRGMRNALGPSLVAAAFALARGLGLERPWLYLPLARGVVGALSLAGLAAGHDLVRASGGDRRAARAAVLALALCVPLADLASRTLGEGLSTTALLFALLAHARERHARAGAWLGLAFVLRYPAGLYLLLVLLAYARARDARACARALGGFAVVFALLGALDLGLWGSPWHSLVSYARYNLLEGRAALDYGSRPWWWLLPVTAAVAPLGFLLCAGTAVLRRPTLPTAVGLGYLLAMSALSHKELRFALPAVAPLVLGAAIARPAWSPRRARVAVGLAGLQGALVGIFYLATDRHHGPETVLAMEAARRPEVGALAVLTGYHPGYALLHRPLPVVYAPRGDAPEALGRFEALALPPGTRRAVVLDTRRARDTPSALRSLGYVEVRHFHTAKLYVR
ncbi:MAG: hypothetical protein HY909_02395 [Deltaproteobacteria bacterium]|nr:hypothetical protein [Deltaproteobacteria bacterium]